MPISLHFFLQLSEPLGVAGRDPGSVALVDRGLHYPVPQRFGIDLELLAHTAERSRPRRRIPSCVHRHPRGPLPRFIGVLPRCCHALHPPGGIRASPSAGSIQPARLNPQNVSLHPPSGGATTCRAVGIRSAWGHPFRSLPGGSQLDCRLDHMPRGTGSSHATRG